MPGDPSVNYFGQQARRCWVHFHGQEKLPCLSLVWQENGDHRCIDMGMNLKLFSSEVLNYKICNNQLHTYQTFGSNFHGQQKMEVLPVRSFTWYRAWVAAHRCRQLIMMHTFQNMWAIYPMANGFPCWFAQTPAASSSVVKEMLERQGLETVSQHRQGQMIEDAIRKAFAEFGECSEVRSASEFGGPLDFPKNAVLGYLISLSHKYVVLRWDFTMHSCRGRCDSNHPGPRKPRWIS